MPSSPRAVVVALLSAGVLFSGALVSAHPLAVSSWGHGRHPVASAWVHRLEAGAAPASSHARVSPAAMHAVQAILADYRLTVPARPRPRRRGSFVVLHESVATVSEHRTLVFPVDVRKTPQLPVGRQEVLQPGQPGEVVVVARKHFVNGALVGTTVVRNRIRPPVPEIVAEGTALPPGAPAHYLAAVNVLTTAYWPNPAWSSGYTATGLRAQYGIVAVDPSVIPMGTRLYIPGYGYGLAADVGSAVQGYHIDLCFDGPAQAYDWGVRTETVFIVSEPN